MPTADSRNGSSCVLVVEPNGESRDVLRTVLQRRGLQILEAADARQGLDLLKQHRPSVTVMDIDAAPADDQQIFDAFDSELHAHRTHLVLLANARRPPLNLPADRVLCKPYHFAPLIRKIETLIQCASAGAAAP